MSNSSAVTVVAFICALALAMAHSVTLAQDSPGDFLRAHNSARREVGVSDVVWDHGLEKDAREYAARCDFRNGVRHHGMNLLWGTDVHHAAGAVHSWVKEKEYYHCHRNWCSAPHGKTCNHYTQVVSDRTHRIGCAREVCHDHHGRSNIYYFVCKYDRPAGDRPYHCH